MTWSPAPGTLRLMPTRRSSGPDFDTSAGMRADVTGPRRGGGAAATWSVVLAVVSLGACAGSVAAFGRVVAAAFGSHAPPAGPAWLVLTLVWLGLAVAAVVTAVRALRAGARGAPAVALVLTAAPLVLVVGGLVAVRLA